MLRAVAFRPAHLARGLAMLRETVGLQHDERHLRRKVIALADGSRILVDLPEAVMLAGGDALLLEDGEAIGVVAAEEDLLEITAHDAVHLTQLGWHIGNRHLPAAIYADRILILRDHVIRAMLEGLGASVRDVTEAFNPVRGAYSGAGHHDHGDGHAHEHGHEHGNDHRHDHHHHDRQRHHSD